MTFFAIYRSEFLSETSGKMEIIKGIKWDPSDAVDKEIYEMQVEYIKTVICLCFTNIIVQFRM